MNEALGYAAALAVLATFLMQSMGSLRVVAILSNALFVSYGYFAAHSSSIAPAFRTPAY
jgi:hypothetical protein